jgi:hypothetical protein
MFRPSHADIFRGYKVFYYIAYFVTSEDVRMERTKQVRLNF